MDDPRDETWNIALVAVDASSQIVIRDRGFAANGFIRKIGSRYYAFGGEFIDDAEGEWSEYDPRDGIHVLEAASLDAIRNGAWYSPEHGYHNVNGDWQVSRHQFAVDGWHDGRRDARGFSDNVMVNHQLLILAPAIILTSLSLRVSPHLVHRCCYPHPHPHTLTLRPSHHNRAPHAPLKLLYDSLPCMCACTLTLSNKMFDGKLSSVFIHGHWLLFARANLKEYGGRYVVSQPHPHTLILLPSPSPSHPDSQTITPSPALLTLLHNSRPCMYPHPLKVVARSYTSEPWGNDAYDQFELLSIAGYDRIHALAHTLDQLRQLCLRSLL